MRMTQPTPMKPYCPTACGPSNHSPLPIEMPRAIRLGPIANLMSSRHPILRTPKTSSGVGRSAIVRSGRLTPKGWEVVLVVLTVSAMAASAVPRRRATLPVASIPDSGPARPALTRSVTDTNRRPVWIVSACGKQCGPGCGKGPAAGVLGYLGRALARHAPGPGRRGWRACSRQYAAHGGVPEGVPEPVPERVPGLWCADGSAVRSFAEITATTAANSAGVGEPFTTCSRGWPAGVPSCWSSLGVGPPPTPP